jgi:AcrR family transcriptional regulator
MFQGRKQEMTADTLATIQARIDAGEAKAVIAKELGISRDTLYRYFPTKSLNTEKP